MTFWYIDWDVVLISLVSRASRVSLFFAFTILIMFGEECEIGATQYADFSTSFSSKSYIQHPVLKDP
jgi:hypothetical protein